MSQQGVTKEDNLRRAWFVLRSVIDKLRSFLDTEDYSYVTEAYKIAEELRSKPELVETLSGSLDLLNNLSQMYEKVTKNDGQLSTIEHGLLIQQVVYAITRANIMSVGLEFQIKRLKGG